MLLTVNAEYNNSPFVRMLEIDEETGKTTIQFFDSSNSDDLEDLLERQQEGITYYDYRVETIRSEGSVESLELRHSCSNIAPGSPDLTTNGFTHEDSPSVMGFLRKVIGNGGSVLATDSLDKPDDSLFSSHEVASINTVQFGAEFSVRVPRLVPGSEEGLWRWLSTYLVEVTSEEEFVINTNVVYLTTFDFDVSGYEDIIEDAGQRIVNIEGDNTETFKGWRIKPDATVYPNKANFLINPAVLSRFKYIADSYRLALMALSEGLFDEKEIEHIPYINDGGRVKGRDFSLVNEVKMRKDTAFEIFDFYLEEVGGNKTFGEVRAMTKKYPHYPVVTSILKHNIPVFMFDEVPKSQKIRRYKALRNVEAYFNLMLAECRHNAIYNNDSYMFNMWITPDSFRSGIPNYKVSVKGGGGKWRPNVSWF